MLILGFSRYFGRTFQYNRLDSENNNFAGFVFGNTTEKNSSFKTFSPKNIFLQVETEIDGPKPVCPEFMLWALFSSQTEIDFQAFE